MPFDDLLTPVAVPPVPRHDAATCCSEKQVGPAPAADGTDWLTSGGGPAPSDVGEGWRWLGDKEPLMQGDQCELQTSGKLRYRRRVTPVPEAPQLSPAAVSAMCQRNERAALLGKNATLKAESDQQQEIILHAGLEVERLTAEVERLRLRPEEREASAFFNNAWALEMWKPHGETLRKLLNRMGGGE